jgi:hypothetical protein
MPVVQIHSTRRFSVLNAHPEWVLNENITLSTDLASTTSNVDLPPNRRFPPILALEDLLWHDSKRSTASVQAQLKDALCKYGFILISVHNKQAVRVICDLRESLHRDLFPSSCDAASSSERNEHAVNAAHLVTSCVTYVSEKGVPMYKLGYELCADGVRQVFRIAGGTPDSVEYPPLLQQGGDGGDAQNDRIRPSDTSRTIWLQGLGFLRHVTDTALDLILWTEPTPYTADNRPRIISSKRRSALPWWHSCQDAENGDSHGHRCGIPDAPIAERAGDFSVLYAMHYFNTSATMPNCSDNVEEDQPRVAVKAHVDPSLLVVEPFLCPTTQGLQVWDRIDETWLDCDGPDSLLGQYIRHCTAPSPLDGDPFQEAKPTEVMLLFAGKGLVNALAAHEPSDSAAMTIPLEPTLHRVVVGDQPRRTVIYEQKYAEFYPPPSFD